MLKINHSHCCYCRRKFVDGDALLHKTKDHFYPSSRLGNNTQENKLESCWECNHWKDDKFPEAWLSIVEMIFKKESAYGSYRQKDFAMIIGSLRYWIKRMKGKKISQYKY